MILSMNLMCLIDISNQSKYFKNFRTTHRSFRLNERVTFRLRDSDIIFKTKMTMINEKIFLD